MSKGLSYILGILTGILLTLGAIAIIAHTRNNSGENGVSKEKKAKLPDGVTMLDEPIPFTEAKNFKILQVVFEDAALAQSEERIGLSSHVYYGDPVVLIVTEQHNTFYDDQIIKTPKNGKVMQIGTYKYQTKMGWKTVPIIHITEE